MKHAHKFLCKNDLPWLKLIWNTYYPNGYISDRIVGSFWWKSIYKLIPEYKQMATCTIGTGNTIQVWKDDWGQGILQYDFPHLFSFCQQPDVTITQWMGYEDR